jgi:hypothetical protein
MNSAEPEFPEPRVWPWWRHLLLHVAIWSSIGAIFALQLRFYRVAEWDLAVRIAVVDWSPWILLGPLVFWLGQKVQFTRRRWHLPALVHLGACIGVAVLVEFVAVTAFENNWIRMPRPPREGQPPGGMQPRMDMPPPDLVPPPQGEGGPGGPPPPGFGDPGSRATPSVRMAPGPGPRPEGSFIFRASRARASIPIYWVIVAVAHAFVYHRRALERDRRALQAESRLVEARLTALQAQLNPHFLFNTLNAVVHYVRADPDAAEEMLTTLSEMLRTVLACADRREVSLEQELAFVDHYLAIQRVRFADRLSVRKEIAPETLAATVPTLLLQPLVENAVIHGVAPERTPGTVFLRARVEAGRLHLEVADTGRGAPRALPADAPLAFKEGIGLSNTRARLTALFGEDFHLLIAPAPEGGVCVRIDIPLRVPTPL